MTLANTIADYLGDTDPERPIPYTLTPKALAVLAEDAK
jgi:hypothetical protein